MIERFEGVETRNERKGAAILVREKGGAGMERDERSSRSAALAPSSRELLDSYDDQ